MSDPGENLPPPPGALQQRNGCLTAIMVICGIILLLPGLCALVFGGMMVQQAHPDSMVMGFVAIGLLVGLAGIMLLVAAVRGNRRL